MMLVLFLDDGDRVGHGRGQHQRGGEGQTTQPEGGQGNVSAPLIFLLKVSVVSEGPPSMSSREVVYMETGKALRA